MERAPGAGAFSDFAAAAASRAAGKPRSSSIERHFAKAGRPAGVSWTSEGGARIEWRRIADNWAHFKASARLRWSRISDVELDAIRGRRSQLAACISEAYGISQNAAYIQLELWQGAQKEP